MSSNAARMPLIDALKALASQIIVLHHFSAYGPLSEAARDVLPDISAWLYDYGRMAVQIFLVMGGFLAARSLAPTGAARFENPMVLLWKRYLRLAIPFIAAILFAIVCSAVSRAWMDDDAIPDKATLVQFAAHATLLHGIFDFDALSAGVWYVAIDFQLFALLALALWLARPVGRKQTVNLAPLFVAALGIASLFYFNLDANWDSWGFYFFGSYALGVTSYWASDRHRSAVWMGAIWVIGIATLVFEFRTRISLAVIVAMLLGLGRRSGFLERFPDLQPVAFLGRISYSVFLIHFPIFLLVSALYDRFAMASPSVALLAMATAWASSIVAGYAFHHLVETRSPGYWPGLLFRQSYRLLPRAPR